jgi:hypothetical protein
MAEGQGNITYGPRGGAGGGGIVVTGARNGLSIDTLGNIVLGEDIGASGSPAALISDREIPMAGFYLNYYNGKIVVSPDPEAAAGNGMLQIIRNGVAQTNDMESVVLMNNTAATSSLNQNSPGIYLVGQAWDGTETQIAGWLLQTQSDSLAISSVVGSGSPVIQLSMNTFGQISGGQFFGTGFVGQSYQFNDSGSFYTEQVGAGDLPAGTLYLFPTSSATDPTAIACANFDDSINREYFVLGFTETANMLTLIVGAQGTGVVRPVAFLPPIMYGSATAPTAQIHITGSTGSAGTTPIKLTEGPLVATPEGGSFEFEAGVLYFSTADGTRKTVTLI